MRIVLKPGAIIILLVAIIALTTLAFLQTGSPRKNTAPATVTTAVSPGNSGNPSDSLVEAAMAVPADYMKPYMTFTNVAVKGHPGGATSAYRFVITKTPKDPWGVSTGAGLVQPVRKGQNLVYSIWARSSSSTPALMMFEENKDPFTKSFYEQVTLTPEWKEYRFSFKPVADFKAGTAAARCHIGTGTGTIELAGLKVVAAP